MSVLADLAYKNCQNKEKFAILADLAYKTCQNKEKYIILADFAHKTCQNKKKNAILADLQFKNLHKSNKFCTFAAFCPNDSSLYQDWATTPEQLVRCVISIRTICGAIAIHW